jgi:hypothetical protein
MQPKGSHAETGIPIAFGTCSEAITLYFDRPLEERLMDPPKPIDKPYVEGEVDFDVWLHMQLLGAKNNFNKL